MLFRVLKLLICVPLQVGYQRTLVVAVVLKIVFIGCWIQVRMPKWVVFGPDRCVFIWPSYFLFFMHQELIFLGVRLRLSAGLFYLPKMA